MKHSSKITILLLTIFIFSQVIGLLVTNQYIDYKTVQETGEVEFNSLPLGLERPEVAESSSFIYIIIGVLLGTGLVLLLVKFKKTNLWKLWYFLAILLTLTVALAGFMPELIAGGLALAMALMKIFKPQVLIHNISEVLVYGGIAAIFVPVINIFSAVMLLILISLYDMYAVWKSKHMVKMAKFQSKSKLFAGIFIPYNNKGKLETMGENKVKTGEKIKVNNAILGGGDIAFPLIFTAVILKSLIKSGLNPQIAFLQVLIITITTTITLGLLFYKSEKGKFYPAMPFVSIGCFVGYGLLMLI